VTRVPLHGHVRGLGIGPETILVPARHPFDDLMDLLGDELVDG
jgi:hypothetical protein